MKKSLFVFLLALFLYPLSIFSQNESAEPMVVEAVVVDAETGSPLPFSSVYVVPSRRTSTITNAEGTFRITVEEGEQLKFSYAGFKTLTLSPSAVRRKVMLHPTSLMVHEKKGKDLKFEDDLHQRIDHQKYDRDFWQQNEIIRRTRAEEAVHELFDRKELFGVF